MTDIQTETTYPYQARDGRLFQITEDQAGKVLVAARVFGDGNEDAEDRIADAIVAGGDFSTEGMRRAAKQQAGADVPDVAHGDGTVPEGMIEMLPPDEAAYRVVTYPDGWEGVEAPGEVVRFFDAKGVRLAPQDDARVRQGDMTELDIARLYAKAGAGSSPYSEISARRSILRDVRAGVTRRDPRAGRATMRAAGFVPRKPPTIAERKQAVAEYNREQDRKAREERGSRPVADLYGRPQPGAK